MDKYYGWTNKETWIINLWLNSEESMYNWALGVFTNKAYSLEEKIDIVRDAMLEHAEERLESTSMLNDLLRHSLVWRVNWGEINDSFNE